MEIFSFGRVLRKLTLEVAECGIEFLMEIRQTIGYDSGLLPMQKPVLKNSSRRLVHVMM